LQQNNSGSSQSGNGSTISRGFNSGRLPGASGAQAGTRQDWLPYVSSHVSCVVGRNGGTNGRTAEAYATCSHLNHHGSVRECFCNCQTNGQSGDRAAAPEKSGEPTHIDSINKGNCGRVPLIGQFWTVATTAELPVTL